MIVNSSEPVTLVGGADLNSDDLTIAMRLAPKVVAADSGANKLLSAGVAPDAIYGDMDSISDAARAAFADRIHQIDRQDTTDLEKVLDRVAAPAFVAIGFLGQRLDHTFAALRAAAVRPGCHVVFLGSDDAVCVIRDRSLRIEMPVSAGVGVLPLGAAEVQSKGLKWELEGAELALDGLISSSNAAVAGSVSFDVTGAVAVTVPRALLPNVLAGVLEK